MQFHSARPLDGFPALRSASTPHITEALATVYGARRFSLLGDHEDLWVHANHWQAGAISLSYCSYGAHVEVEFPEAGFYRQQIALRGGSEIHLGGLQREISERSFCVVPPDATLRIGFRPGFEQIVLRVDAAFVQRKFLALSGDMKELHFDFRAHDGGPAMARLRRLLGFLIAELEHGGLSEIELGEIQQSVAVCFLQANPHADDQGMPAGGTRQTRMVEDYIEAHWQEPLSVVALARVTGMSARTVFHQFRKDRGVSPMAFVKQVRLRHAHDMLVGNPDLSITEIAFACGFGNLGHFARDYRARWGERPSETRRRALY